jgi:hypothetical protein
MKKIIVILTLASLIIVAAMVSLVKKGISLRINTLIKPSEISANDENVAPAIAKRLFPDLQSSDILIIGLPINNPRLAAITEKFIKETATLLKRPINTAANKTNLKDCTRLCVVITSPMESQELEKNIYIESAVAPLGRNYFTLNIAEFDTSVDMNGAEMENCEKEKFLDFKCLALISLRDSKRKMKDPTKKYFFMKKYQDRGHYLFLQSSK